MSRPPADRPGPRTLTLAVAYVLASAVPYAPMARAQETSRAIEWPVVRQSDVTAKPADAQPSADAAKASTTEAAPPTQAASGGPANAVAVAVRALLADPGAASNRNKDDVAALAEFYADGSATPLWVDGSGLNSRASAVIKTFETAADWGLEASAFDIHRVTGASTAPEALAEAELTLSLSALKYARFARGGRLNPPSLSRILDMRPPVKDPKNVIADLAKSDAPDKVLRDLHPKHEQFERLRQALLKSRGPAEPEQAMDPVLAIKIPKGATIKKGAENADVAVLRKRLKVPVEAGAKENVLDEPLSEAIAAFQVSKGLPPTGTLTNATRTALNAEGEPKKSNPKQNEQRLIVNMEKWRWMPEDLGNPYVWNNIPEFQTRTIKDGKEVFKEKIIVGMPEWATPVFAADMEFVIFYPSWGVPDGIKTRELLPRLQKAGGGGFFDQLFGGGGSAGVMKAYGLTAYRNGKVVDPDSINPAEIRSYSFVQPSGGQNPLGIVKFRFPNPHDVYMHDTTQRNLFAQSYRAMSHGCIRVQNPMRFAEVLLGEDRGWSPERVKQSMGQGDITLEKKIPVYMTYFTAMVDDAGKLSTYGDLYGHDGKISSALGRAMQFDGGNAVETASIAAAAADAPDVIPGAEDGGLVPDGTKKGKKDKNAKQAGKKKYVPVDSMSDAVSGLLNN